MGGCFGPSEKQNRGHENSAEKNNPEEIIDEEICFGLEAPAKVEERAMQEQPHKTITAILM
jgi:hypothetical protein